MVVRYGFFGAEKDDDAALESRVEAMCREIGSRAKNEESSPMLPEGVPNERPVRSSAPSASAVRRAVEPEVPASAQASAPVLPPSDSTQPPPGAGSAVGLPTTPIGTAGTMREIQALLHAETDRAHAQADKQREAMDSQIRALQVLQTTLRLYRPLSLSLSLSLSH